MSKPKVSIVTSVYKADLFIDGLLENVVSQTCFDQCEWIMIQPKGDGFSKRVDESIKIYQEKYSNILYSNLETDPSVYAVWNNAIIESSGDFITNWNCDDRRYPDSLQKQIDFFEEHSSIDLIYNDQLWHREPNWIPWDKRYNNIEPYPIFHTINYENKKKPKYSRLAMQKNLPHNDPIWRSSLHKKNGYFREDAITVADHEFWLRCINNGAVFEKIENVMGIYYHNPNGISTKPENMKKIQIEYEKIIIPLLEGLTNE
jgi:glycosyltransferase involved in cell wall biosynthesis